MKVKTSEICIYGILGALTFALKFAMSAFPNIEPVSLLIIVYAIAFGIKAIYPVSIYVIFEIVFYGVGIWSIGYVYIWFILLIATLLVRKYFNGTNVLIWATISGVYGLAYGALYMPIYIVLGDMTLAVSWWLSGVYYDVVHCVANFILCIALFKPLTKLICTLNKQYKIN